MTSKLQQSLIQQKESTEQVNQQIPGRLGIPLDGQRRVEVSNRNAYVYVRLRSNQSEVIQAYNNQVAPAYDLPVLVQRAGGRYEVVGVDTASYENNWNSNAPFLPRHGNTHSFDLESGGGGDAVWVYPRQFMPALVLPSGSVGAGNLIVSPYTLQNADGTWKYVGNTGTANITQYNPSSSSGAVMGLVYLDAPSGNPYLIMNTGTVFSNTLTGSSQIYPYIPTVTSPSTQIPLVAVRLITGTSQLSWDNIYDVRQFIHTTPTGSSGGGGGGIDTIGIAGQDEGVNIGTGTVLNVVGAGATFSRSGTVLNLNISGGGTGSALDDLTDVIISGLQDEDILVYNSTSGAWMNTQPLDDAPFDGTVYGRVTGTWTPVSQASGLGTYVQNEGIGLGTGTTLNFVGDGVHATISGTTVTVSVTGSSSSCGTYQRVEQPIPLQGVTGTLWQVPDLVYASGSLGYFYNGVAQLKGVGYEELIYVSGTFQTLFSPSTGSSHMVMYGVPCVAQTYSTGTSASEFALQDSDSELLLDSDSEQLLDSDG